MASPAEFKKFCLSKGNFLFTGSQTSLDGLWEFLFDLDDGKEIFEPSHVGYVAEHDLWLLGNVAVQDGNVYEANEHRIIWIGDRGFRARDMMNASGNASQEATCASSHMEVLSERECEALLEDTLALFKANLGYRGWLVLGWIYALLHADEIFRRFKFFPGLFLYGKLQSGKDVLAGWIMSFFGLNRTISQSFSETTQVAANRLFAMFSSMPVWFDEFRHTDSRGRWKYAFFRGVYNRTGAGKGVKDDPLAVRSVAIRGAALLCGEQLPGDAALRSRYIRILLSRRERNDDVYGRLEHLSEQFSALTVHWLRKKTPESSNQLLDSISEIRQRFVDECHWDERTAEVHAVAVAGLQAITEDSEFLEWVVKYVSDEREAREQESVLSEFFDDLNTLLSQQKIDNEYLDVDGDTLIIWHTGVYRVWQEDFRRRTSDEAWPWETLLDHLREEGCLIKHKDKGGQMDWVKQKKLRRKNRKCIWIDIGKAPAAVKEFAEAVRAAYQSNPRRG